MFDAYPIYIIHMIKQPHEEIFISHLGGVELFVLKVISKPMIIPGIIAYTEAYNFQLLQSDLPATGYRSKFM